jgi:hypothetical protein
MSESEAEFRSNLEDLESLLSFYHQSKLSREGLWLLILFDVLILTSLESLLALISECTPTPTWPTLVPSTI